MTDSTPVERLPGTGKAKVVVILVDRHGLFDNGLASVHSRSLSTCVVKRITSRVVFDWEEVADVARVGHVVHLAMGLRERVPVPTGSFAGTWYSIPLVVLFIDSEAVFAGRRWHLLHFAFDLNRR